MTHKSLSKSTLTNDLNKNQGAIGFNEFPLLNVEGEFTRQQLQWQWLKWKWEMDILLIKTFGLNFFLAPGPADNIVTNIKTV